MIPTDDHMTSITFLHRGKNHCPQCGRIGNRKKQKGIEYHECPFCCTEYTENMIIHLGDAEDITFENN